jgi:hypothetical protein
MLSVRRIPTALLALILLLAPAASAKDPASNPPGKTTVGEFALKVINLAEGDSSRTTSLTAEQALARLRRAGLRLEGSPGDLLTDKDRSAYFMAVSQGLMEKLTPPPTGFDACMGLGTVPECQACCLGLAGGSQAACGRACGQDHADQRRASPSEPTP